MIATWQCVDSMWWEFFQSYWQFHINILLKSLLTTSLAVFLQLLFWNYLSILIAPSKCFRNVHWPCKCNVISSSNINVRSDSSKFRLVIWKRTKDKEDKDILTKFTTMAPVHSCVSRGNKITLSLTDKVKLLFVSIRKILNKSMDFYPTLSVLQHFSMAIIITSLKIYST